jgi:hypothetical protein
LYKYWQTGHEKPTTRRKTMRTEFDPAVIQAAREWLIECFESQEEEILEAPDQVIYFNVCKHHDGGWNEFLKGLLDLSFSESQFDNT